MRRFFSIVCAGACCLVGMCPVYGEVTFESLLREMTDLERLTRFPQPAYTCKQFSSYDRRSTDKNVPTDENWFANGDRGHHLRVEERNGQQEWVMMDAEGPGAIVRIWSANPQDAGVLRIYLDGSSEPTIEMLFIEMLCGEKWPFVSPIAHFASAGWNSYLPIPYAKHCKVTASSPNFYYHINYRTYEKGTQVISYSEEIARKADAVLQEMANALKKPDLLNLKKDVRTKNIHFKTSLKPRAVFSRVFSGPGAFYAIETIVSASDMEGALRGCVLEIRFDDARKPQVLAPLGDFFGTAPGANRYLSLPSGVREDGSLYAHWVMPFRRKAVFRMRNLSSQPVDLKANIIQGDYKWDERSLYFHTTWRSEHPIPTHPRQDWNYVQVEGKGVFVGDMLHVTNSVKEWWGEGDEKIYVDGEDFPSHFGTGSEDYYGYAWCSPQQFTHAYHNQPRCDGPGNYGHTCVSRFHILDNIPFHKSFQFDIEVWHARNCEIAMAATSFWYGTFHAKDTTRGIDKRRLVVVPPHPLPPPRRIEGALEGEDMKVVSVSGGQVQPQTGVEEMWSAAKQLWWVGGKPGDSLVLEFSAPKTGRFNISAKFTKAPDYGVVQLKVNGQPVGEPIDFYNETVRATPLLLLGQCDLHEGANTLSVEIVGKNDKAIPSHMFGLDCIVINPVENP